MTERLYEIDPYLCRHTATVLSSESTDGGYSVVLDRTAFFPEGGGQACDLGTIDGIAVTDVRIKDGVISHTLPSPLTVGASVLCEIDGDERLQRMQCHSGEHIVSGLIHSLYGFDNVGFHLGSEEVTLDINGELSPGELSHVETLANGAVAKNLPIRAIYPTADELPMYDYRSKLSLSEGVRLIEIPGYDLCACCAPHVCRTGEIGEIKLIGHVRYKGGVRIRMLCGFRALEDHRRRLRETCEISELLSAKEFECADAVRGLLSRLDDAKREKNELVRAMVLREANAADACDGDMLFVLPSELAGGLRELVNTALPKCGGICAAFAGSGRNFTFIAASSTVDLRARTKPMMEALSGKGGGSPSMIQGSVSCDEATIREYFK